MNQELCELYATWLERNAEEERNGVAEAAEERERGEEGEVASEIPAEVETPVAFTPQDLPTTINIDIPSPILQFIEASSVFRDADQSPDASTDDQITATSSPTLSISTISNLTLTEFDEDIGEDSDERTPTRHETFYLEDGNVEIACGQTIFRIHSTVVSFSSPNLRDMLSSSILLNAPISEGCPRVVFNDSAEDFAVFLKMIYTPRCVLSPQCGSCELTRLPMARFLARNGVPEFSVFASLLGMTTKHGFLDIREALVENIKGAYPTKWEDFETARVLGEDVFGSPRPHPNAVLNLFLEQRIKFALPLAAYRAGLGGPSVLASEKPGTALPRLTLVSIIHNMGGMRRSITYATQTIAYTWDLGMCSETACILNVDINLERRTEALKKISDVIVKKSEGDILSSLKLMDIFCVDCAHRLKSSHRDCRKHLVWARLPGLLGLGSWEDVWFEVGHA